MKHQPEVVASGEQWQAVCTCFTRCPLLPTKQEAEDWTYRHLRLVEQTMVHLRSKNPTIKDQYTYYAERAADPNEPPESRRQWYLLAAGLVGRLPPTPAHKSDDEPLPFEVKYQPRRPTKDRP